MASKPPGVSDLSDTAASQAPAADYVWLGDLSGWEICGDTIQHRCGYVHRLDGPEHYLANAITDFVLPHVCRRDRP